MPRLKIFDSASDLWTYVGGGDESPYVGPEPPIVVMDGMLWWDTDDNSILPSTLDPAVLAADPAFTTKYALKPLGFVGEIISSTNVTGITTTETDIISGVLTLVIGRRYELTIQCHYSQTVATDSFTIRAYIGATRVIFKHPEFVVTNQMIVLPSNSAVSATTSTTIKATAQRSSGTGSASCLNSTYINGVITCKDIGV